RTGTIPLESAGAALDADPVDNALQCSLSVSAAPLVAKAWTAAGRAGKLPCGPGHYPVFFPSERLHPEGNAKPVGPDSVTFVDSSCFRRNCVALLLPAAAASQSATGRTQCTHPGIAGAH